ncbi:MAG: hypothetical protein BroJett018_24370 [Chloroflexota bacterium]|nr:MAG: hypothetical protein BroJett018_24370 [Chloroflexota bacterium]
MGIISTRHLELELLPVKWNFKEIVDYIDADYPEGAVDIEYDSDHDNRTFFIALRFKARPAEVMKFVESICDGVLYQGYDPFDTIDGGKPSMGAKLIVDSGGSYYSHSPNAPQSLFGNRCQLELGSGRWEHIRVDTSDPNLYEVRYEIPVGGLSRDYSPQLFFDGTTPLWRTEYINPTTRFPFMIVGLMSTNNQYILVGETICFETRRDFEYWTDKTPGLPASIYPRNLIGTRVAIFIDDVIVIDTTISDRWTLSHPDQNDVDFDLLFNYCVFQKNWQSGTHTITLHVDMPDFQGETWTFEVK